MAQVTAEDESVHRMRLLHYPSARTDHLRRLAERLSSLSSQVQKADQDWDVWERELLQDVGAYALQRRRADLVSKANQREQQNFAAQEQQLQIDIEQAHRDIVQAKLDLEAAKIVRSQNEEYEALRRLVMEQPKRSELQAGSEELDQEIAAIAADDQAAEHAKQWRKKQFTVLMHYIRDIQLSMDDEPDDLAEPMQTG